MHFGYKVFDAHCDTVTVKNLFHTKTQFNRAHMKKYDGYIQVFAICADGKRAYNNAIRSIKRFDLLLKKWGIKKIENACDIKNAEYGGILALEGADAICNVSALKFFYDKGVRLLTLTWNNSNKVASGIEEKEDKGLSEFGKKIVAECEKMGIVIDLSHIGDKGFYDVCDVLKRPFICSHSNSRTINPLEKRNITDRQFKEIIKHNGVCGINLYGKFLGGNENADIDSVFSHIEHFCSLGGTENIGIGSDFDGIGYMPKDCSGARYMDKIAQTLLMHNYSETDVNKILYENFSRVFCEILR